MPEDLQRFVTLLSFRTKKKPQIGSHVDSCYDSSYLGVSCSVQQLFSLRAHNNTGMWTLTLQGCTLASQVSLVKSEETKVRQEDLSKLLYEVQLLRTQQDNMECQVQDMKQ